MLGEFEGIREQVFEHLLQTFRVGDYGPAEGRIHLHVEGEAAILGLMPERACHHIQQVGEDDLLRVHRDRAGFDLRQVKDVADQVQQVSPGTVNRAGELDLPGGQIAVGVVGELLTQDQDTVERRAQLVRHVGQELGLVLGGQGQLGGLLFQGPAGLFDLLVLALHLDVLLGELLGFLRQLLVGLLQLFLLRLQLGGELLRLFEQPLGLHGGLNAIEHDADTGRELFEERQVRGSEGAQ